MKTTDLTCCFVDHGLYLPLARKLSETYQRVLYYTPWETGFPKVNDCCVGDGFDCIERCDDFWPLLPDIDLFVFPDILHGGLQEHLRDMGKWVWGSGQGYAIETNRLKFLELLQQTELPLPGVKMVRGVSALREHLRENQDKFIKISKYRGTMETWHWRNWSQDAVKLDMLAVRLGALSELLNFMVCDPIETDIEVGGDTYCIDGKFPTHMMEAYEWKDKSAFGAFKPRAEVTPHVTQVMEAFGPFLDGFAYRNFFSVEVRVKDGEGYFIDPCCRGPLPMTFSQCEVYGNLAEIVLAGAQGELVSPTPTARFSCECILTAKVEHGCGAAIEWPGKLRDAMKISRCAKVGEHLYVPPDESEGKELTLGWLVATGDTARAALEKQLDQAKQLPDGVECATGSLADLLKEIIEAEAQGIEFSPGLPRPEEVVAGD